MVSEIQGKGEKRPQRFMLLPPVACEFLLSLMSLLQSHQRILELEAPLGKNANPLSFDLRRAWQCQGLHSTEMQTSKSDSCAPGRSRLWAQSRQTGREEPGIPVCSSSLTTTAGLRRQSRASPDPPQAA